MKVAVLTNILTPYRIRFFDQLQNVLRKEQGSLKVFVMTAELPMRPWTYQDLQREYTELLKGRKYFYKGNDYLINPSVVRRIMDYAPEILIVAGSWTYPTFCFAAFSKKIKRRCKILLWTESHDHTGIRNSSKVNPFVRKIKKVIFSQFDGFCIPGEYAFEMISNYVDIDKKLTIKLPNLVDNHFFDLANDMRKDKDSYRKHKGISDDVFVFFTPASLYSLKGHLPFFINVTEAVNGKNAFFVLAGEGPDEQLIRNCIRKNNIRAFFCGYQNQEQIREWLAISDAFLLPSLSDANPLSNIEAAWAGLPLCVSCYVGNGPELVEDKVNGVIFDTLNGESVCEKINFILNQNTDWLVHAGEISHQKARKGFDLDNETQRFVEQLEILKNK